MTSSDRRALKTDVISSRWLAARNGTKIKKHVRKIPLDPEGTRLLTYLPMSLR